MTKIKNTKLFNVRWHIISIVLFVFFEIQSLYSGGVPFSWIKVGAFYLFHILFFYISALYFIPLIKRKLSAQLLRLLSYLSWIATYAAILSLVILGLFWIMTGEFRKPISQTEYLILFYRSGYLFILAKSYSVFLLNLAQEKEARHQDRLKAEAQIRESNLENAFLRSQLNPHFLFNALSFIHRSLVKISSPVAGAVLTLAEMMRYNLGANKANGLVTLDDDLDYIEHYLLMQQMLNDNKIHFSFKRELSEDVEAIQLPPLLFYGFVENVFKHGNLKDPALPANISIVSERESILFTVRNYIANDSIVDSYGIGMENSKERLEKFFPGKHFLEAIVDNNEYKLNLKIDL